MRYLFLMRKGKRMVLEYANKEDILRVKQLYLSAFPKEERPPFFFLRRGLKRKGGKLLVAKEQGKFLGFAYLVGTETLGYLFFFAMEETSRGLGYGSQVLRLLKEAYCGKRLFLARETLEDTADNYAQRLRRHKFYLRNGFEDLPCQIQEGPVVFDVMGIGGEVSPQEYTDLMDAWGGKWLRKAAKMHMTVK